MNNNYVIAEDYELPSLGKIYDASVNPQIKLRSMTTNEEMKRLSRSDRQYKIMADIIDDCSVQNAGISSYDMCIGDYQYLLHKLRVVTYGPDYKLQCKCPYCLLTSQEVINLDQINVLKYDPSIKEKLSIELPVTKKHITLKLQTPRDLDDIALESKDYKKRFPKFTGESAILFTLKHAIKEVDGGPLPYDCEDWLRDLPLADSNKIISCAKAVTDMIGLDLEMNITCPICGLTYTTPFRFTSEFFGPTYD